MRTKVAAGHEADRAAVYRKVFGGNDNIEAIRRLRSSKTISSGVVRPTAIRADLLEGKLRSFRRSPERLPDIRKSGCRGLFVMCGKIPEFSGTGELPALCIKKTPLPS